MPTRSYGDIKPSRREIQYRALPSGQVIECCSFRKRDGKPCMQYAGMGTDHPGVGLCRTHGGTSPSQETHGARELITRKLDEMKLLGLIDDTIGPEAALLEEVGRAAAAVQYYDMQVNALTDTTSPEAQVLIEQWNEQRKMAVNVSKTIVRAGIAQRQVQVQEMQAAALVQVILAVVTSPEMSLSLEQQAIARKLTAVQLRAIATSATEEAVPRD